MAKPIQYCKVKLKKKKKNSPANAGDARDVVFLGWEDPPELVMATHSSILA